MCGSANGSETFGNLQEPALPTSSNHLQPGKPILYSQPHFVVITLFAPVWHWLLCNITPSNFWAELWNSWDQTASRSFCAWLSQLTTGFDKAGFWAELYKDMRCYWHCHVVPNACVLSTWHVPREKLWSRMDRKCSCSHVLKSPASGGTRRTFSIPQQDLKDPTT